MMPKIRVRPAASRNNSMPSWMPFRHCSIRYNMGRPAPTLAKVRPDEARPPPKKQDGRSARFRRPFAPLSPSPRHIALIDVFVGIAGGDLLAGLHRPAVSELFGRLQVEVLHRDVVLAEL